MAGRLRRPSDLMGRAAELERMKVLTHAQPARPHVQEEMGRRGLDTKWDPLKGKRVLVDRLQVGLSR